MSEQSSERDSELNARLSQELREAEREQKAYYEHLHPPCPVDGQGGRLVGFVGSFQMIVMAYECPRGHKFSYRDELEELEPDLPARERSCLLSDQSGRTIHPKEQLWPDAE